jgi:hypothetical protein
MRCAFLAKDSKQAGGFTFERNADLGHVEDCALVLNVILPAVKRPNFHN